MSFSEDLKEYRMLAKKRRSGSKDPEASKRYLELSEELYDFVGNLPKTQKALHLEVDADSAQDYYGTYASAVFEIEGKFYRLTFNMDSWRDDGHFGDFSLESNIVEVRPVERVVTVYEEVKDE